jgi:precorrin-2 dehydrogenase/sirohydrochlorin ferrochelatase
MNSHDDEIRRPVPYSVALNLEDAPCLVVGGGTVALRKIEALIDSGAKITVVSPDVAPEIEALEEVEIARRKFRVEDLRGRFLVISATDDREVNELVAKEGRRQGMLVNVVDVPELCNFYVNAQVRRGDLTISVSTGGASPALAGRIRRDIEREYGEEYADYLLLMREYRPMVIRKIPDLDDRGKVFKRIAAAGIEKVLRNDGEAAARKAIEDLINEGA